MVMDKYDPLDCIFWPIRLSLKFGPYSLYKCFRDNSSAVICWLAIWFGEGGERTKEGTVGRSRLTGWTRAEWDFGCWWWHNMEEVEELAELGGNCSRSELGRQGEEQVVVVVGARLWHLDTGARGGREEPAEEMTDPSAAMSGWWWTYFGYKNAINFSGFTPVIIIVKNKYDQKLEF